MIFTLNKRPLFYNFKSVGRFVLRFYGLTLALLIIFSLILRTDLHDFFLGFALPILVILTLTMIAWGLTAIIQYSFWPDTIQISGTQLIFKNKIIDLQTASFRLVHPRNRHGGSVGIEWIKVSYSGHSVNIHYRW
ncbi:hypothetical protein G7062_09160 [Erysipelothrix sp. HDW6C]|uniref:hypothetical protein n=1 Tax=Erysipelothrix sp. HDW6C TaxID=2714930 RepID=UPI0014087F92|nr:hypothetical protein [Erysipelothrix sp. HDW6C]QIK70459.1 hypothetical protein G7062_09160 [Erysipelothrix sp. HDW6C]